MSELSELTTTWVRGWVAARGLPAPDDLGHALRVQCRQAGREIEIFARNADDEPSSLTGLAVHVVQGPDATWLTVPTTRPEQIASVLQESGLSLLRRSERLMTADLQEHPHYEVPTSYRLHIEPSESAVHVEVRHTDGELAARGVVGLAGTHAVIDRILTWPEHRRRGLANAVMSALAVAAVQRGAGAGILIASEDGQRLYSSLGWSGVADVLIAAAPGAVYPQ